MQRHTHRSLFVSLVLHIGLILVVSPFLVRHFHTDNERIIVEILDPAVAVRQRQRTLPPRTPLVPRVSASETAPAAPTSPTYVPEVRVPKAPVHADVVPDIVTHADLPQAGIPSLVSNMSVGADGSLAGPVVGRQRGGGGGRPGRGGPGEYGTGDRFAHGTGVFDVALATFDNIDAGLGIFDTAVKAGYGLIGQVYVPGGPIYRMPDFDRLTPVYTFVTPNLDVPKRDYTAGFPTPEMQSVVEDFAIRFRGALAIDTPGLYKFGLYADDGAKLYINGTLVVDNDGIHAAKGESGSIMLSTGVHPVEIHYFQGPRYAIALQWYYQPPKGPASDRTSSISVTTPKWNWHWQSSIPGRIVPPEIIYRPGEPHIPDALKKLQKRLQAIHNTQ